MGWAVTFLVLFVLVMIFAVTLINWKIQIYKVIVQLQAILDGKTKKMVTMSLSDSHLEQLVEIINEIALNNDANFEEILKREQELKENISGLSHDLRTPLTSIRGYLQLFSNAPVEKKAEYITALSGKALRLERLIDDFYHVSLLEAGQYPFSYENIEFCSLLTETMLDNYSLFSEKGIEPNVELPNTNIHLYADKMACTRIIQNLLFNALNATSEGITVRLFGNADSLRLYVNNPITDVPTEEYSKLLERFYVSDASRSKGTSGQGLYIVKKLLLRMNCKEPIITVHNYIFEIEVDFSPLLITV